MTAEGFVETSHDVAEVAATPIADAGATERLAVALTAARVRVDQDIPGPGVHLELVRVVVTELPMRSAVDPEQRWISFAWIEAGRLHNPTVDGVVVPAIDEPFRLRRLDGRLPLAIEIGERPLGGPIGVRDENLGRAGRVRRREGDVPSEPGDGNSGDAPFAADDPCRRASVCRAHAVRGVGRAISGHKKDPVTVGRPGRPGEIPHRAVQAFGETHGLAALERDREQMGISAVVPGVTVTDVDDG